MIDYPLMLAVIGGIVILLVLILVLKLNAFLSLLIASISVGLFAGMPLRDIMENVTSGMGNTLGFVAIVIGLGAIFGAILDHSGGTKNLALYMLNKFGERRSSMALLFSGFIIAIPVFLDVAFIILVPIINALSKRTGKHILVFGLPLLAGLAVTHSFIPPTPGPVAAADILKADLGWVIMLGFVVGFPTAIFSGIYLSRFLTRNYKTIVPVNGPDNEKVVIEKNVVYTVLTLISLPIVLILQSTILNTLIKNDLLTSNKGVEILIFLGHPISALIICTLCALYIMGTRHGFSKDQLFEISNKSLAPAGSIILITGAGGVLKQMLIETGAGNMIAEALSGANLYFVALAYIIATLVRVIQGSATVAMITAAGIMAPLLATQDISDSQNALIVLAIAAGSVFMSHVNDSGFWLVNRYLNLSVPETLRTVSVLTTGISIFGFLMVMILFSILN